MFNTKVITAASFIFLGCCSNVITLEVIVKFVIYASHNKTSKQKSRISVLITETTRALVTW